MRNLLIAATLMILASNTIFAQSSDPVVLRIAGEDIKRSEFEYSYNKNKSSQIDDNSKSLDEYVDMFVNYRLKVKAAEDAKLDTLQSFKKEFGTYRDMQLVPYLVDSAYVDSVAHSVYDRMATGLGGADLIHASHILLLLPQKANSETQAKAKAKIDSIYNALQNGADFKEMAKRFSQDPGSARQGGQLPWFGPKSTLKEFEDEAYALKAGEMSKPFLTTAGYHIVLLNERKPLEPYAEKRAEIYGYLNKQGIANLASHSTIDKMIKQSGQSLTREMIMQNVLNEHQENNLDLKYLVKEYHDGLLLYEICNRKVWQFAAKDEEGLKAFYKKNKKNYTWDEPRFKGFVIRAKDENTLAKAKKFVNKLNKDNFYAKVNEKFNTDSVKTIKVEMVLCKLGDNKTVDELIFGKGKDIKTKDYPFYGVQGKTYTSPTEMDDVRSLVVSDYQDKLEKEWLESLHSKYSYEVNKEAMKTVNNHK